jgi:hypothetical protein
LITAWKDASGKGRFSASHQRRGARTFEVTEEANARFLDRMTNLLEESVVALQDRPGVLVAVALEGSRTTRESLSGGVSGAPKRLALRTASADSRSVVESPRRRGE